MCGKGHSFWLEALNKTNHVHRLFLYLLWSATQGLQVHTYKHKMKSSSIAQQRTVYQFLKLSLCVMCVCGGGGWGVVVRQSFILQPMQASLKA